MLVAAVAPFERAIPGSLFGFTLTTVELTIAIAMAIGARAWWKDRAAIELRTPLTWPLAAIVVCAFVAALAAPEFRGNAVRAAARLGIAVIIFTLVANAARSD